MIPIQTLARESFIREHGDLLRELCNFLKRFVQLSLTEFLGPRRDMGRLFEQAGGVRVNVNAVSGSLTAQFFRTSGLILIMIVIAVAFLLLARVQRMALGRD